MSTLRIGTLTWGASSPPTSPIPGYQAWWDASQIGGVADGAALASWSDLSGFGHTLSQSTGAAQPTYYNSTVAKLINGRPAVWFDGTDDTMATASWDQGLLPYTIAVVAQSSGASQMYWCGNGGTEPFLDNDSNNKARLFAGVSLEVGSALGTTPHSFVAVVNGLASSVQIDGTTFSGNAGTNTLSTAFNVGRFLSGNSEYLNGPICELLIYHSSLSTADQDRLYLYLKNKWGTP